MLFHATSTTILIVSGIFLWIGVAIVFSGGSFMLWTIAKGLYVLGAILFLFNK